MHHRRPLPDHLAGPAEGWYCSEDTLPETDLPELQDQLTATLRGRYAIEREIGHGGMAVVYLARDLKHDRESP